LDGEAPGLFNFRSEDIDPRYPERLPEMLRQFKFSPDPVRGNIDSVLMTSEGFLSADAAAVLGSFPQDPHEAAELLRDYNFPPHLIADWKTRAVDHRAKAKENEERLRRGEINHRQIITDLGFNGRR
jgi:hypothetical protein